MAVPAYFYDGKLWDQLLSGGSTVQIVVLNPSSGPGDRRSGTYAARVAAAQAAGITVIGYVHTLWGERSLDIVKSEIDRYMAWYGVDGIFLDEGATRPSALPYYAAINDHIKSYPGQTTAINPGTYPDEGYMNVADIVLSFEGVIRDYKDLTVPAWALNYGPERFWHIVYASRGWGPTRQALDASGTNHAHYLYVSDDWRVNPFDTLPRFWDKQIDWFEDNCGL